MSNLKTALKGYDILHSSGNLDKINKIKLDLTNKPIKYIEAKASKTIFGEAVGCAELVTRQFLLMSYADLSLNKQILNSVCDPENEITLMLPAAWRKIISSHGIKVSKIKSKFKWNLFLISHLLRMIIILSRTVYDCILKSFNNSTFSANNKYEKYVYLFSLDVTNFPQPDKRGVSHDFISWYINWIGRSKEVKNIYHNVKNREAIYWNGMHISYLVTPFLTPQTKKTLFKYCHWCIKAVSVLLFSLITGRWWNILMLEEALKAIKIRFMESNQLAEEYYFNNSGWIYRPLWTYEAEAKGSEIVFYFYSTNCETFAVPGRKTDFHYGYQSMNWPHYLVWDKYQEEFVRNATSIHSKVSVVGPIWFATSGEELDEFSEKTIAVFDVQPVRDAFYKTLGISFEYYVPRVCNQFLLDIYAVCEKHAFMMAQKRKREIGKKIHPAYRNNINKLKIQPNYLAIDANLSANALIEKSVGVISMPFTSTAILGRLAGKPSVYYDPLNLLQKDDPAAHGIQIISGIDELYTWFNDNFIIT